MNEKPESPIGVHGNLCVTHFHHGHSRTWERKLRSLLVAFLSPVVPGVALDGDSRKSLPGAVKSKTETYTLTGSLADGADNCGYGDRGYDILLHRVVVTRVPPLSRVQKQEKSTRCI